jgi:hypothetical protein
MFAAYSARDLCWKKGTGFNSISLSPATTRWVDDSNIDLYRQLIRSEANKSESFCLSLFESRDTRGTEYFVVVEKLVDLKGLHGTTGFFSERVWCREGTTSALGKLKAVTTNRFRAKIIKKKAWLVELCERSIYKFPNFTWNLTAS